MTHQHLVQRALPPRPWRRRCAAAMAFCTTLSAARGRSPSCLLLGRFSRRCGAVCGSSMVLHSEGKAGFNFARSIAAPRSVCLGSRHRGTGARSGCHLLDAPSARQDQWLGAGRSSRPACRCATGQRRRQIVIDDQQIERRQLSRNAARSHGTVQVDHRSAAVRRRRNCDRGGRHTAHRQRDPADAGNIEQRRERLEPSQRGAGRHARPGR